MPFWSSIDWLSKVFLVWICRCYMSFFTLYDRSRCQVLRDSGCCRPSVSNLQEHYLQTAEVSTTDWRPWGVRTKCQGQIIMPRSCHTNPVSLQDSFKCHLLGGVVSNYHKLIMALLTWHEIKNLIYKINIKIHQFLNNTPTTWCRCSYINALLNVIVRLWSH